MNALVSVPEIRAASGYKRFIRTPIFAALLLGLMLATPSAVSYIFITSSQAAGTAVTAVLAAFFLAPVVRFRLQILPTVLLLIVICGHFFVARNFIPVDVARFASSLALLVGMVIAAHFVAQWLSDIPETVLRRSIGWLRMTMIFVAILSMIHLEPPRWDQTIPEKAIFPFTEHSHFALVFTPLILEGCVRARGLARPGWLVVGLLVAVLLQNLTILIGIALIALITAPLWQLAILLVAASGAALGMDLTYYLSRLDLSTTTNNLSALVYIQGYEFITDSFFLTSGWGLGFQQLGTVPMNSLASNVIYVMTQGESLNLYDGGFGASKVISEFGALGVAATLYLVGAMIVLALRLRRMALSPTVPNDATLIPYCFVVGFAVEMFARGVGYFSATVFMLIVAFLLLRLQADRRKVQGSDRHRSLPKRAIRLQRHPA